MNCKRRVCIFLLAVAIMGLLLPIMTSAEGGISVSAESAVLYVPETSTFLYEKNADVRMPMASTTKIMTALIVLENAELCDKVKIPMEAVGIEGSSAYLRGDERLTVEELLYALMLQSANDVAVTLAYHIGGDVEAFADMMNERAEEMGLQNTHFTNSHGLDNEEHYTSAHDLAIIAAEALKNQDFKRIVSAGRMTFATEERRRTYVNHNKLLRLYDGCIGVKTGFTKKSGRCLVGAAEKDGLTMVSVTLDAPNDWNDHERLLDLGYSTLEKIKFCDIGDFSFTLPVLGGKVDSLSVQNTEARSIIIEKSEQELSEYVKLVRYAIAPVNKGDILGEVIFTLDGEEVTRVPIVATESIPSEKENKFIDKILSIFK